jgi:hypothetical protein
MIHQGCPKLEHLGLLNFSDSRVSDAIIQEIGSIGTENFLLDSEDAISGILPNLKRMTFYIGKERDREKIISAVVLGMSLARSRGIYSKIAPWCQEDGNQDLIMENLTDLIIIQELMEKQLDVSLDQFVSLWGNNIDAKITFEISFSVKDTHQLDLLYLLSSQSKSVNVAITAKDVLPTQLSSFILPENTRRLSINTDSLPLDAISQIIAPLKISVLTVDFQYTFHDETDEKVMMVLVRDRPAQQFAAEWASEPIMSFNMAIWGDMISCDYGDSLFEAVVGRAIGRTTWESRKNLESITRTLFEKNTTLKKVEIIATYPLYREELSSPRLFKL